MGLLDRVLKQVDGVLKNQEFGRETYIERCLTALRSPGDAVEDGTVLSIDVNRSPIIDADETIHIRGSYRVHFARAQSGAWIDRDELVGWSVPAEVLLTDKRLIVTWANWLADRSGGSILERRILAPRLGVGVSIPGGHVRLNWIQGLTMWTPARSKKVKAIAIRMVGSGAKGVRETSQDHTVRLQFNVPEADAPNLYSTLVQLTAQHRLLFPISDPYASLHGPVREEVVALGNGHIDVASEVCDVVIKANTLFGFQYSGD